MPRPLKYGTYIVNMSTLHEYYGAFNWRESETALTTALHLYYYIITFYNYYYTLDLVR